LAKSFIVSIFIRSNINTYIMKIGNLIVEVTRKCNIYCDHCLRGEPMNVNMKKEYIDSLLNQVDSIGSVCFSGGEPTLNLSIMEYFLDQCKDRRIDIGSFYIVTNGKNVAVNFVSFLLKLYSYCDDKESCSVQVSNDYYHKIECTYDISMLEGLKFFSKKYGKDGYDYDNDTFLKTEGRREGKKNKPIVIDEKRITVNEFEDEVEVYLNCKGEIINGCDWSYTNQKLHKLCDVGELSNYYQELIDSEVYS